MIDKVKDLMGQFGAVGGLFEDANFKALISNPKVLELFKDNEFIALIESKDFSKIMMYPKFGALMRDPELATLMSKIDFKNLMGKG